MTQTSDTTITRFFLINTVIQGQGAFWKFRAYNAKGTCVLHGDVSRLKAFSLASALLQEDFKEDIKPIGKGGSFIRDFTKR